MQTPQVLLKKCQRFLFLLFGSVTAISTFPLDMYFSAIPSANDDAVAIDEISPTETRVAESILKPAVILAESEV